MFYQKGKVTIWTKICIGCTWKPVPSLGLVCPHSWTHCQMKLNEIVAVTLNIWSIKISWTTKVVMKFVYLIFRYPQFCDPLVSCDEWAQSTVGVARSRAARCSVSRAGSSNVPVPICPRVHTATACWLVWGPSHANAVPYWCTFQLERGGVGISK